MIDDASSASTLELESRPAPGDDTSLFVTSAPGLSGPAALGEWFGEQRVEGWERFQRLPAPARDHEQWRFASIKALDLSGYTLPKPVAPEVREELIARSLGVAAVAGRMIFANDQLLDQQMFGDSLRQAGVIWTSIERAAVEHPDLFRQYFMQQEAVLGSAKFAALHRAQITTGTFLYVPRGIEIAQPIEVFHWLQGEGASTFPHTLLIAGEASKVTVVDYFGAADPAARGFACGVNDLHAGAGAKLNYINVQNWSRQTLALQMNATVVGRDASALSLNLNLGGAYGRTESVSRLVGAGGRSDMLAVSVAEGTQEFDQRTLQDHQQPHTYSDLLYKNSLSDAARTIFAGLIRVEPGAHGTDAYQKVRNLLLSDEAEANSMPGLEILADDVKCSHGATSGQIAEEELFYLMARGISKQVAQQLIVFGFLNEVFTRVGDGAIEEKLRGCIQAKFDGMNLRVR